MNEKEFRKWLHHMLPQFMASKANVNQIVDAINTPGTVIHIIFNVGRAYGERRTPWDRK